MRLYNYCRVRPGATAAASAQSPALRISDDRRVLTVASASASASTASSTSPLKAGANEVTQPPASSLAFEFSSILDADATQADTFQTCAQHVCFAYV